MAAAAIKSSPPLAVLGAVNNWGNASFYPLINVASPGFYLPSSASFTFNCSLDDYLGDSVMVCYKNQVKARQAFGVHGDKSASWLPVYVITLSFRHNISMNARFD